MAIRTPKTLKVIAAAVAIATACATVPGVVVPAEAKRIVIVKKVFHFGGFHRRIFVAPAIVAGGVYYAGYGGCYWLKKRALFTGLPYWWNRYHACISE